MVDAKMLHLINLNLYGGNTSEVYVIRVESRDVVWLGTCATFMANENEQYGVNIENGSVLRGGASPTSHANMM